MLKRSTNKYQTGVNECMSVAGEEISRWRWQCTRMSNRLQHCLNLLRSTSSTRSMSSAINWRSHQVQLITVAVSTCLVTAGALSAFQTISKRRKRKELEEEVRRAVGKLENGDASRQRPNAGSEKERLEFSDHLIREQLARCYAVFQEEGMAKVRKARVVIVGCGGVGSWAAMMLVRSYVCIRKTSTFYRSHNEELGV